MLSGTPFLYSIKKRTFLQTNVAAILHTEKICSTVLARAQPSIAKAPKKSRKWRFMAHNWWLRKLPLQISTTFSINLAGYAAGGRAGRYKPRRSRTFPAKTNKKRRRIKNTPHRICYRHRFPGFGLIAPLELPLRTKWNMNRLLKKVRGADIIGTGVAMLLCRRSVLLHRDVGEVRCPHGLPLICKFLHSPQCGGFFTRWPQWKRHGKIYLLTILSAFYIFLSQRQERGGKDLPAAASYPHKVKSGTLKGICTFNVPLFRY